MNFSSSSHTRDKINRQQETQWTGLSIGKKEMQSLPKSQRTETLEVHRTQEANRSERSIVTLKIENTKLSSQRSLLPPEQAS